MKRRKFDTKVSAFHERDPYKTKMVNDEEGIDHYFISFRDGEKNEHEIEVTKEVYQTFLQSRRITRSFILRDADNRILPEMTDKLLFKEAHPPKSVETVVFESARNKMLRQVLLSLPEIQRTRLVLYYDFGLTYEQIGELQGCSIRAVKYSVDLVINKLRAHLATWDGEPPPKKHDTARG